MKHLIGERLNLDWRVTTVSIIGTLLLLIDRYHKLFAEKYWDRFFLYLIIPLFITVFIFRENPNQYGFSLGNWKLGWAYTVVGILFMTPILYGLGQSNPAMQALYSKYLHGLPFTTFLDLFGWEFFFRGWLLFTFLRAFGHNALWLQAIPFAMAHAGKPEVETMSTIFGGFAFAWVAWRTNSFIYPFLIHWYIGTFIILVAAGVI